MHHGKQKVLMGRLRSWKSKHSAHHHGWFYVEKARLHFTEGTKAGPAPPASHPLRAGLQAAPQMLAQMSANTKTDASAIDRWCFTAGFLSRVMRGSDRGQAKGYVRRHKNFPGTISHSKDSPMLITTSLQFAPVTFLQSSEGLLWPKDHEKPVPCFIRIHKGRQEFLLKFSAVSARSGATSKPRMCHLLASRPSGVNKLITASSDSLTHSFIHSKSHMPYTGLDTIHDQAFLLVEVTLSWAMKAGKEYRKQPDLSTEFSEGTDSGVFESLWLYV